MKGNGAPGITHCKCPGLGDLQLEENGQKLLLKARKMYRKHKHLKKEGCEVGERDDLGFYESIHLLLISFTKKKKKKKSLCNNTFKTRK